MNVNMNNPIIAQSKRYAANLSLEQLERKENKRENMYFKLLMQQAKKDLNNVGKILKYHNNIHANLNDISTWRLKFM